MDQYSMSNIKVWKDYGWAISMAIWVVIGVIIFGLYGLLPIFSVTALLAYTCFSLLGFLGFMLGIPGVSDANQSPTNLELIADWLTKLLIGAGLIELKGIFTGVTKFSVTVGAVLGGDMGPPVALLIIIAFSALGLITGYLWSQLHFKT